MCCLVSALSRDSSVDECTKLTHNTVRVFCCQIPNEKSQNDCVTHKHQELTHEYHLITSLRCWCDTPLHFTSTCIQIQELVWFQTHHSFPD